MLEFRIRQDGFKEIRRRMIVIGVILFTVVILVVGILPAIMSDDPARFETLPVLIPLLLAVCAFSIYNGIKKQRPLFESFVSKIDDEKIVRERLNTHSLAIYRHEVTAITKHSNGSYTIQGKSKLNPIGVPAQIDDHPLLETTLNEIKPVTVLTAKTFSERMVIPASLSGVALMGVTIISSNETVGFICSILFVIILLTSLVIIQQSKNVDRRTKRLSWVALIPILAYASAIVGRLLEGV